MPGSISALHVYSMIAPLPMYSAAAQYGGLVDHIPEKDGKIRRVPLVAEFQGRLIPQMALVLACAALDVEPGSMEITDDRIIIPTPDGFNITFPKNPAGHQRDVHGHSVVWQRQLADDVSRAPWPASEYRLVVRACELAEEIAEQQCFDR
jgi:hypothetical protein